MPDIRTKTQYAEYERRVAEFIASEGLSFLSTGCDEKPWFSWYPCECCSCTLGGNREYLFGRNPENEIVKFTICEDCVYYVNYGRLDDTTMAEMSI